MDALQSVFECDDATLKANRSGKITDAQRETLAIYLRHARFGFLSAFVMGIITLAIFLGSWAFSNPMSRNSFQAEVISFSLIGLILLLFLLYSWMSYRAIVKQVSLAEVLHVEGIARKTQYENSRTRLTAYFVTIDTVKFQLDTKKKWETLEEDNRYCFHYIDYRPTNIILAVEAIK